MLTELGMVTAFDWDKLQYALQLLRYHEPCQICKKPWDSSLNGLVPGSKPLAQYYPTFADPFVIVHVRIHPLSVLTFSLVSINLFVCYISNANSIAAINKSQ